MVEGGESYVFYIQFNWCVNSFEDDIVKRVLMEEGQWLSWNREIKIAQKVTKMGSIIGHRMDYNR